MISAFTTLGLLDPVEFEAQQLKNITDGNVRRVGTTTRMLVMVAHEVLSQPDNVIVRFATFQERRAAQALLYKFIRDMGGSDHTAKSVEYLLLGENYPRNTPKIIFTDHMRDVIENDDRRVLGPLGGARYIDPKSNSHLIYGYDWALLGEVSDVGLATLQKRHFVHLTER